MKHIDIRIYGRVQGINFRESASLKAQALNIFGLAGNEPDGSVLIEAEGEDAPLDKLVTWCHKGPELAKVERVEVEEGQILGYNEFKIKY